MHLTCFDPDFAVESPRVVSGRRVLCVACVPVSLVHAQEQLFFAHSSTIYKHTKALHSYKTKNNDDDVVVV
jgi:hypothetical protein